MSSHKSQSKAARALTLATNTQVLGWRVILLCAVLSVLVHLAPNGASVSGNVALRIPIAFAAFIPGIAIILLCRWCTSQLKNPTVANTLTLVSYLAAGAIRGLCFAFVYTQLGMSYGLDAYTRIPSSTVTFSLLMAASVYAASALDESRQRISSLHSLKLELEEALQGISQRGDDVRSRSLRQIEASIRDQLKEITQIPDAVTRDQLRTLVSDVVRPLSHQLAERVPLWEPSEASPAGLKWKDVLRQISPEHSLRPFLLSAVTTSTALTTFIAFFGIELAIPLVICSFVMIYLTTRALNYITRNIDSSRSLVVRFLAMTLSLVAVSVPAGLVDAIILRDTFNPWLVLEAGVIIVPIFGWSIALAGAAQAESARIADEYQRAISEMSWLKARLNMVSWSEQGELARVLHGPVQSAMNKGVLLWSAHEHSQASQEFISDIRREISQALSEEFTFVSDNSPFEQRCKELAEMWEGVCQIDLALSPEARIALRSDKTCKSLAWDVVSESCSNAIRHGKATWILVRIPDPDLNVLTVEVSNNGSDFIPEPKPGLGSNLLEACTLEWHRRRINTQTVLTAHLPIQYQAS